MKQLLVVITPHWDATSGLLFSLEQSKGNWNLVKMPVIATVGKAGLAQKKREGDLRSPAGLFPIGNAFGYEQEKMKLPYILIDEELECVDDPESKYYNRFVKASEVQKDWKSSEMMLQKDGIYERGLVIEYNTSPVIPHAGSCIFMHKWRFPGHPTAGCTALSEENLKELLQWLDPEKAPHILQLTEAEFIQSEFFSMIGTLVSLK